MNRGAIQLTSPKHAATNSATGRFFQINFNDVGFFCRIQHRLLQARGSGCVVRERCAYWEYIIEHMFLSNINMNFTSSKGDKCHLTQSTRSSIIIYTGQWRFLNSFLVVGAVRLPVPTP
jgi:hypothetical protein